MKNLLFLICWLILPVLGFSQALNASYNGPLCRGDILKLSADTLPGAAYFWTGPNGFFSNNQNPRIVNAALTDSGTYYVAAFSLSGTFADSVRVQISNCVEICDNGLDDDFDGLVDCFDPDCCGQGCEDHYFTDCPPPNCQYMPATNPLNLTNEWTYTTNWQEYNTPIVGDLDGDSIPEVIGKKGPFTGTTTAVYEDLLVIDGATGQLEATIQTPRFKWYYNAVAIMDADSNGYGEIYFTTANDPVAVADQQRLFCYEYNPATQTYAQKWRSNVVINQPANANNNLPNFADFNKDGIPEIYVRNQIFNALTGVELVNGGNNSAGARANFGTAAAFGFPVAADVLPDGACLRCEGLELVAGNQVYAVDLYPGNPAANRMTVERQAAGGKIDGFTALADVDRDGDLDAIVTTCPNPNLAEVYIWDLQTTAVTQNFTLGTTNSSISIANAADFDGDGFPEFGICTRNRYTVLEVAAGNLVQKWSIATSDVSGATSSTVFDFEGDGLFEVIYRDETRLRIFNGATGTILYQTPCNSGTSNEYPVIVDVDADGETELLCSCGNELRTYRSNGTPWVPTRKVWNQQTYFNTNIKDDLTIPRIQQSPHIVGDSIKLNTFLSQAQLNQFPAPDISTTVDHIGCDGDSLLLRIQLCNNGDISYPANMPISLYPINPTRGGVSPFTIVENDTTIAVGSCIIDTFKVFNPGSPSFYAVANDDGSQALPYNLSQDFPITAIGECNFDNNLDSTQIILPQVALPDTVRICHPDSVNLNAGPGFVSYQWSSGQTSQDIFASITGRYSVRVLDNRGCRGTDSSWVSIVRPQIIPGDTTICQGDTLCLLNNMPFVDTVQVDSFVMTFQGPFDRAIASPKGQAFLIRARGFYTDTACGLQPFFVDPAFFQKGGPITPTNGMHLQAPFDTLRPIVDVYNPTHLYTYFLVAGGDSLRFSFRDNLYTDNCGRLTIQVFELRQTVSSYLWSTGDTTPGAIVAPAQNTSYNLTVTEGSVTCSDTVQVTVNITPQVDLGPDTTLCVGDSLVLAQTPIVASYLWQDGSTGTSFTINQAGIYWLEVSNACATIRDSIVVSYLSPPDPVNLGPDTLLCAGDNLILDASQPNVAFLWQDGSTLPTFTAQGAGLYGVIASNQCGIEGDTIRINPLATPQPFSLGADTTLCVGDSLWLSEQQPQVNYLWQNNTTNDSLLANTAGLYWLEISNLCGSARDSINIDFLAPPAAVDLGPDTLLCAGDTLLLDASQPNVAFLWQDGSNLPTFVARGPGLYGVVASNQCGVEGDTLRISPLATPQPFSLGADTTLCTGDSLWLSEQQPQVNYLWQNNTTNDSLLANTAGLYWLEISNLCGSARDSINIGFLAPPAAVDLGPDTLLCAGDTLLLDASQPNVAFLWQDGSNLPTFVARGPGLYGVVASNQCGVEGDTLRITPLATPQPFSLGADTTLCTGDSLWLSEQQPQVNYLWQNNTTNDSLLANTAGLYWLEISNLCGSARDSINIGFLAPPAAVDLGPDTLLCAGDTLLLDASQPNVAFLWQDGSNLPTFVARGPGLYGVIARNQCGIEGDSIRVDSLATPQPFSLGADTTLCDGESLLLTEVQPQVEYLWQDGSTNDNFRVSSAGLYWLDISNLCGQERDSIQVAYLSPPDPISLGADTMLCEGESLLLTTQDPSLQYIWQDGSIGPTYLVTLSGTYRVSGSNACGSESDSIEVDFVIGPRPFDLGADSILCTGDSLWLGVNPQGLVTYQWSDGTVGPFRWVTEGGTYELTAENRCGSISDVKSLEELSPPSLSLPSDTILCPDETLSLEVFHPDIDSYRWQDGDPSPGYFVDEAGIYSVTVANSCDTAFAQTIVEYQPCECKVYMANAFSPNGDSRNDEFYPVAHCNPTQVSFSIFNRWGQLVFQGASFDDRWDGTYNGQAVPEGVYVWVINYSWEEGGFPQQAQQKGTVTLIR